MSAANILIIEDDADIREGVRILLEGEDYTVAEAPDGASGLKLVSEDTDLIILDVMMPGMSGLKTCEEIRKFSYVPVLFLTAKTQESDKLIGLMAGGDDYLAKPFSYSELLGRCPADRRIFSPVQLPGAGGRPPHPEFADLCDRARPVRPERRLPHRLGAEAGAGGHPGVPGWGPGL